MVVSPSEATAEVLWTAFLALPPKTRDKFMEKVVCDPALREELEDLLNLDIAVKRSDEPTRPLDEVLAELDE